MSVGERRVEIGVGRAILVAMGLVESMCRYTSAHFLSRGSVKPAEFFIVEQALAVILVESLIIERICFGEVRLPYVSQQFRFGLCAMSTEIASKMEQPVATTGTCVVRIACFGYKLRRTRRHFESLNQCDCSRKYPCAFCGDDELKSPRKQKLALLMHLHDKHNT